jgi:uncharacterized protein YacL
MILHLTRALFILMMAAVGWFYVVLPEKLWTPYVWLSVAVAIVLATIIVCIDILSPRKKLAIFSGTFFGLVVGLSLSYALSFVVRLVIEQTITPDFSLVSERLAKFYQQRDALVEFVTLLVGISVCYLSISFVLQTKDDFKFLIPYIEFARQSKGPRPILLDTSVLIDGRVVELAESRLFESQVIVPRFVLDELHHIADSGDKLKRTRGRRGLDVLRRLQDSKIVEVRLYEGSGRDGEGEPVDHRLVSLAKELNAKLMTNDTGLEKVAQLRGLDVINLHAVAAALRPAVLVGEKMLVRIVKSGDQPGQGVGYLDDGTMVVVEHGRAMLNSDVEFIVTSALQTTAGRMIFGRLADVAGQSRSTEAARA